LWDIISLDFIGHKFIHKTFLSQAIRYIYRAFAHDVTAAMLVFQFKIILIRLFCLEHQHGNAPILLCTLRV
jgi:hypothetical protein